MEKSRTLCSADLARVNTGKKKSQQSRLFTPTFTVCLRGSAPLQRRHLLDRCLDCVYRVAGCVQCSAAESAGNTGEAEGQTIG